jgi:hypothetical protein
MARKKNILFIIAALVLIPVLLGLTPVKFVQKLGSGCPFNHNKVSLSCNPCIYHSVTLQGETGSLALVALPSTPFVFQSLSLLSDDTVNSNETVISNPLSEESPPLRC